MMQANYRHAEKLKTLRLLLFDDNASDPIRSLLDSLHNN